MPFLNCYYLLFIWPEKERETFLKELDRILFCFTGVRYYWFDITLTRNSLDEIPCKTIAVMLLLSLALYIWPAIIAFEYEKILRSRYLVERPNILYLRYCTIAFGLPFTVISICVTVDTLSSRSLIRYGSQDYCWVFPFHARLAMYIVPFSIVNFGSFFLVFIVTIQTKYEKKKSHCMPGKKDQLKFSTILMKLCLLFGTTELIGLVQIPNVKQKGQFEVIFSLVFGLLYNFLRRSRGIFMFVLFTCNRILKNA